MVFQYFSNGGGEGVLHMFLAIRLTYCMAHIHAHTHLLAILARVPYVVLGYHNPRTTTTYEMTLINEPDNNKLKEVKPM